MRISYSLLFLMLAVFFLGTVVSSCSDSDEDIAAPTITFIQPHANDTIHLLNGSLTIKVKAEDKVNIKDMEMVLTDESGNISEEYDNDYIDNQSYTCYEPFELTGITHKTKMSLRVTFENEFKNWSAQSIVFYVKP